MQPSRPTVVTVRSLLPDVTSDGKATSGMAEMPCAAFRAPVSCRSRAAWSPSEGDGRAKAARFPFWSPHSRFCSQDRESVIRLQLTNLALWGLLQAEEDLASVIRRCQSDKGAMRKDRCHYL